MADTTLTELADQYERIVTDLRAVAERVPGAFVIRNHVGNLAIIRADGIYAGYVDVFTGEVVAFGTDGKRLTDG